MSIRDLDPDVVRLQDEALVGMCVGGLFGSYVDRYGLEAYRDFKARLLGELDRYYEALQDSEIRAKVELTIPVALGAVREAAIPPESPPPEDPS